MIIALEDMLFLMIMANLMLLIIQVKEKLKWSRLITIHIVGKKFNMTKTYRGIDYKLTSYETTGVLNDGYRGLIEIFQGIIILKDRENTTITSTAGEEEIEKMIIEMIDKFLDK
jgi:hypothetical protein